MSFLRRLFGGEDGRTGDGGADRPSIEGPTPPPPLGPRSYLEFVGGSAAKFYAAVLEPEAGGTWRVSFNFGRIGYPRDWAQKVDGATEAKARGVYSGLVAEKLRKGYELRPWPPDLALPSGEIVDEPPDVASSTVRGIYVSAVAGRLPTGPEAIGGVDLPPGRLIAPEAEGGPRGTGPVLWVTDRPVKRVAEPWTAIATAFPDTGLWPLIVDPGEGIDRMREVLMDIPRSTGADPFTLLRRWWHENVAVEDDEVDDEAVSPFGRKFPGLAGRTPGERPASIEAHLRGLEGHLGLVAVERPARVLDAIGWMGPANHDMNPTEQSAILDTWEDRFDAYLVGLGFDTITLAVGRPPRDRRSATAIAAEHLAFCPDNIYQGVGSISEYAPSLIGAHRWDFWWD